MFVHEGKTGIDQSLTLYDKITVEIKAIFLFPVD
jgi:hypothetical protein